MSRAFRSLTAFLAVAAALGGCVSKPPLAVRRFVLDAPAGPLPTLAPDARVLALPPVRVNPAFLEPSLVYRLAGGRVEIDHYASLAAPPRALLSSVIRAFLLREPFVRDVVPGLAGPSGLTLEVVAQELSGDFRDPVAPVGALDLELAVYAGDPPPGATPLLRKVYSRREPLPDRSAVAVVGAWNRALASIMKEVGTDLAALPLPPPPTASPRAGRVG